MGWERGAAVAGAAAVVVAACGASGGLTVLDGAVHHPRDEAAFQAYLVEYIGGFSDTSTPQDEGALDTAWVLAHPDEALRAGNVACDWLRSQPLAPALDPTGETTFVAVADRYVESRRPVSGPVSEHGLGSVMAGAWEYLCWTDRELRTARQSTNDD